MQQFKDRFNLDQNEVTKTTQARAIVALIAIAGMFLPWVWLDGDTSPMNAGQLLAYAFTNPERGAMISISFPGTIALLFTPPVVICLAVYCFIKTMKSDYPLMMNAGAVVLPIVMIMLSGPVTSSDDHSFAGLPASHLGAILVSLCHASLLTHGILQQQGYLTPIGTHKDED